MEFNYLNSKEIKIFLTFFIIYIYFVHWVGWNEDSRFDLTRAIVEEHRFDIDSYANNTGDRAFYNGHFYSDKAPGASFLAVPVYATYKSFYYNLLSRESVRSFGPSDEYVITNFSEHLWTQTSVNPGLFILTAKLLVTIFNSCLFTALTVVLIYKIAGYFHAKDRDRVLLSVTYGLGTLAFPHALVFFSYAPAVFFSLLAFYVLLKEIRVDKESHLYPGLFSGIAIVFEYTTILILVPMLGYILLRHRKIKSFIFGLIIGIIPLIAYNYLTFGVLGASFLNLDAYWNDVSQLQPPNSLLGYVGLFFSVLPQITIFPYRGLFFYSPILLISLYGICAMYKKFKMESIFILAVTAIFLLFGSINAFWWGGACFGPRSLAPMIPFLTIPLIFAFKKIDMRLISTLLLFSIFINLLGLQNFEDIMADKVLSQSSVYQSDILKGFDFKVIANPLHEHYWPLFIKNGPRSRIFENLLDDNILPIDIRDRPYSKGGGDFGSLRKTVLNLFQIPRVGTVKLRVPFLCLVPLLAVIALIWRKELSDYLKLRKLGFKYRILLFFGLIVLLLTLFVRITPF